MQQTDQNTFEQDEINLLELAQVLVRRRKTIIGCCAGFALFAAGFSATLPNTYKAEASVLPPQKEGASGLTALLGQAAGGLGGLAAGLGGFSSTSDVYVGILKSRSVADAVIARLDLVRVFEARNADDARKRLSGVVKVQTGKEGIITVSAEMKSAKLAADVANALVTELGRKSVQLNLTKAGGERAFLEKRLELVKGDLKRAEEDMRSFQEANRTIKADAQAVVSIEGVARLKAELASREVQLASLRAGRTEENQEVKVVEGAIARLRGQIAAMEGTGTRGAVPSVGNVPALGLEYARRMRNLKVQEAIFEQLTKQYEMAKLTEAKDSASLQVLDDAVPPLRKSGPHRAFIVAGATICGFFVSAVAALMMEFLEKLPDTDRRRWEEIKGAVIPRRRCS